MEKDNPVVFVVDDDEAVCESLRLLIGDIGLEVRTFTSAKQFLEQYDASHPGCLVLDVRMSGMSGLELQSRLVEMAVRIPTIIITGHADVPMAVEAMKTGAMDFIEKPFRDQVLLDSIQKAVDMDLRTRREHRERQDVQSRIGLLTQREREVMERLVAGKSNKSIAFDLGISQKTVDFHRANILEKVGVSSVVELVRLTQRAEA
jgi:FixJ family two-component response regulator